MRLLLAITVVAALATLSSAPGVAHFAPRVEPTPTLSCVKEAFGISKLGPPLRFVRGNIVSEYGQVKVSSLMEAVSRPPITKKGWVSSLISSAWLRNDAPRAFQAMIDVNFDGVYSQAQRRLYVTTFEDRDFVQGVLEEAYAQAADRAADLRISCMLTIVVGQVRYSITSDRRSAVPFQLPLMISDGSKTWQSYDPALARAMGTLLPGNGGERRALLGDDWPDFVQSVVRFGLNSRLKALAIRPETLLADCTEGTGSSVRLASHSLEAGVGYWVVGVSLGKVPGVSAMVHVPVRDNMVTCDKRAIVDAAQSVQSVGAQPWVQEHIRRGATATIRDLGSEDSGGSISDFRKDLLELNAALASVFGVGTGALYSVEIRNEHLTYLDQSYWVVDPLGNRALWYFSGDSPIEIPAGTKMTPCHDGGICVGLVSPNR